MSEITSLLKENEDLFPQSFTKLEGIQGDLGKMGIMFKPNAKPVKHWHYQLNPQVKEKVKKEIDYMLNVGFIFLNLIGLTQS